MARRTDLEDKAAQLARQLARVEDPAQRAVAVAAAEIAAGFTNVQIEEKDGQLQVIHDGMKDTPAARAPTGKGGDNRDTGAIATDLGFDAASVFAHYFGGAAGDRFVADLRAMFKV